MLLKKKTIPYSRKRNIFFEYLKVSSKILKHDFSSLLWIYIAIKIYIAINKKLFQHCVCGCVRVCARARACVCVIFFKKSYICKSLYQKHPIMYTKSICKIKNPLEYTKRKTHIITPYPALIYKQI